MVVYGTIVVLKRGNGDGSKFPITNSTCTFGRDPSCDIRISLASVAQEHCKLEVNKNGQVTLSDVSKRNQTLLNGVSLKKNAILNHNDIITVADRKFRWECAPSSDQNRKSLILNQNFQFKTDSATPVGIVTPTRRDTSSRDLSLSNSTRKAVIGNDSQWSGSLSASSNKRSKISRRASVPSYYGDPVLTPLTSVSRQRRSKSNSSVILANSSLEESPPKSKGSSSKKMRNILKEETEKPAASKRSRSPSNKRIKIRKLEDENTIKIIAPSSPDHKKSAALRTIHGSKIAVGKKKDKKKLMLVKNHRQKKKYMVQRSEKIKQAVLKLNKTQSLAKNDTLKFVSANSVKKSPKGVSTPASKMTDKLNSSVNLTNMFVSPLQTPNNQSVSFPMRKLISSMERRKRGSSIKSPDLSDLSSVFKTPELKYSSRKSLRNSQDSSNVSHESKISPAKKNISPLKSPQYEESPSDSPKTQASRKSLRKSGIALAVSTRNSTDVSPKLLKSSQSEASSSDSPKTPSTRKSNGLRANSARKSVTKSPKGNESPSPRKSISEAVIKSPIKRISPRKSVASSSESPKIQTPKTSVRSSDVSPVKGDSTLKSQSEVLLNDSPRIQASRKSFRKSSISSAISPRNSRANSKSPKKNIYPRTSSQSETSLNESPKAQPSRKSAISSLRSGSKSPTKNFSPLKSPQSEFSSSKSSITKKSLRRVASLQSDSESVSPNESIQAERSFSDSPKTPFTRKSNISQKSPRISSTDSETRSPLKILRSSVTPKDLTKTQQPRSVSPRKSLSNSAQARLNSPAKKNFPVLGSPERETPSSANIFSTSPSPQKSISGSPVKESSSGSITPTISATSFYSPKKTPNNTSSDFILQLSKTGSSLRSSILIKSPDRSPSKLSPRKSLSYARNEVHQKNSTVLENASSSAKSSPKKSVSPTRRRLSNLGQTELVVKKMSVTPSPTKRKTNSPSPKRDISAKKLSSVDTSARRSSRKVSHSTSPSKSPRRSESGPPISTTSPIKIQKRSESVSPIRTTSPIKSPRSSRIISPKKFRNSRSSSSQEEDETSPRKRISLRRSSKLDLQAIVKIGKRSVKIPAVPLPENEKVKQLARKSPSVSPSRQKKNAAKLAVAIISKAKRRSLNAKSRQRRAKNSIASPNLSGLSDLFVENEDDGSKTLGSAKRSPSPTKVIAISPRRLRTRLATPRTIQKKQTAVIKVTPQTTRAKRKVMLESLNTSTESDNLPNQKQDYYFPEGLKVQWRSPSKSPSPTKVQPTPQRRGAKRGVKAALNSKVDLSPIKESPRKRKKTLKVVEIEQEKSGQTSEETIEEKNQPAREKAPKTPKRQTRAKKEILATSPTEMPKNKNRRNKSKVEASPVKDTPRNIERKTSELDEGEISTAKTTSRRQKAKKDDHKSPTKSKEVKSVRASARLKKIKV